MTSRRDFFKICMTGLASLLLNKISGCAKKPDSYFDNPYKYDIEKFKNVDEKYLLFDEVFSFPVKAKEIKGFTISEDDFIFILDAKNLYIHDLKGNVVKSLVLNSEPYSIEAFNIDEIYIGMKNYIEVYDKFGNKKSEWSYLSEKSFITAIAVDDDKVVLADYGNKHLMIFSKDGKLIKIINTPKFIIPSPYFDVKIDNKGFIWAVNPGKLEIRQYSTEGNLLKTFGEPSMALEGFSGCCNPTHFAIAKDGSFITCEKGLLRVKVYDESGIFKAVVTPPKNFNNNTKFIIPAVDSTGLIYVADPLLKKVNVFKLKK